MSKLFEYAIIHHPKAAKDAAGNDIAPPDVLVSAPKFVLSKSDKEVAMRAAREIPEALLEKLEEVEICVRPF